LQIDSFLKSGGEFYVELFEVDPILGVSQSGDQFIAAIGFGSRLLVGGRRRSGVGFE
jgi:hypothetical protein